ncbi:alpha-L-fucosidase [Zhihengliuella sp. ISTPL4]|uniref:alpha-L-fucosidase n=1 Tax=Zhihengliuella sp. ISTPL4 TaxID=2058657 RepID=UPI000C79CC23
MIPPTSLADSSARTRWFAAANFGLFIHFDQASQLGLDLSWPMVGLTSDDGSGASAHAAVDYLRHVDDFDPRRWDPAALARAAREAGMTYGVFTTKHHSGWASWPSTATPLTIARSPYGRRGGDLVREFVDAFRGEGLRVGLYYSLSDWSDPDYPAWRPDFAPYPFEGYPRPSADEWARYREGLKAEISELLTNYGRIDLLWFDGGWERTQEEWGSADLEAHIRSLQPEIVLNDRLPGVGDYLTPEQTSPGASGGGVWETCVTMNDTWGWSPHDENYKSTGHLLRTLVDSVAHGGNLLLNVGPDRDGALPAKEIRILRELSEWMQRHGESVVGATSGLAPWQFYGPSTRNGDSLFLHLLAWPDEEVIVRGIHPRSVVLVELMTEGRELPFRAVIDPAEARTDHPVGNLVISVPSTRPDTPLPVIRIRSHGSRA